MGLVVAKAWTTHTNVVSNPHHGNLIKAARTSAGCMLLRLIG